MASTLLRNHTGLSERAPDSRDNEWACFAAQQAAEKALKAVVQALGGEAWGHSVTILVGVVSERIDLLRLKGRLTARLAAGEGLA